MTQQQLVLRSFVVVDESDPGCPVVQCQRCWTNFEPDITFAQAWAHLKIAHRQDGEREYRGGRSHDPIAFSLRREGHDDAQTGPEARPV